MTWLNDAEVKTAEDKATELAEQQLQEAKRQQAEAKLTGIEFNGVMCSATKEDQWGLDSIEARVKQQGMSFNFHFENGNKLLITPDNIDSFEAVWFPFRMSFFE